MSEHKLICYERIAFYIQVNSFALQNWSPVATEINRDDFLGISFSHHMEILNKTKDIDIVLFYIHETVMHRWDKYTLRDKLKLKIHETQKGIPNNFVQTIPSSRQALQAVKMFKDEYLLDYINLEDIDAADEDDVDERVVENTIVRNVKRFMMKFGKDFAYVGNQYNLEVFGEEQRSDLLFFNRQRHQTGPLGPQENPPHSDAAPELHHGTLRSGIHHR